MASRNAATVSRDREPVVIPTIKPTVARDRTNEVRVGNVRRAIARRGLQLRKSRAKDPGSFGYGLYSIWDAGRRYPVYGWAQPSNVRSGGYPTLTLADVEEWLEATIPTPQVMLADDERRRAARTAARARAIDPLNNWEEREALKWVCDAIEAELATWHEPAKQPGHDVALARYKGGLAALGSLSERIRTRMIERGFIAADA